MPLCDPSVGHVAFKHLAPMINGAPQVVRFTVDLHNNLIEVPPPVRVGRIQLTLFLRISDANSGPNLFHKNRAVS